MAFLPRSPIRERATVPLALAAVALALALPFAFALPLALDGGAGGTSKYVARQRLVERAAGGGAGCAFPFTFAVVASAATEAKRSAPSCASSSAAMALEGVRTELGAASAESVSSEDSESSELAETSDVGGGPLQTRRMRLQWSQSSLQVASQASPIPRAPPKLQSTACIAAMACALVGARRCLRRMPRAAAGTRSCPPPDIVLEDAGQGGPEKPVRQLRGSISGRNQVALLAGPAAPGRNRVALRGATGLLQPEPGAPCTHCHGIGTGLQESRGTWAKSSMPKIASLLHQACKIHDEAWHGWVAEAGCTTKHTKLTWGLQREACSR